MSGVYRTIVADPPWDYSEGFYSINRTPGRWSEQVKKPLPYKSMNVSDIAELPVNDLAAKDSWLFFWTTNRYLPEAFGVVAAWGFTYRQTLVWRKVVSVSPFGGTVAPNHAEYLLVCRKGKARLLGRLPSSVIEAPGMSGRRTAAHSEKPEMFLDLVESVSGGPYLEMFARRQRLGWDTWGDEALNHVEIEGAA